MAGCFPQFHIKIFCLLDPILFHESLELLDEIVQVLEVRVGIRLMLVPLHIIHLLDEI